MRTKLQPLERIWKTYIATLACRKVVPVNNRLRTKVLLKEIRDSQYNILTSHVSTVDPICVENLAQFEEGDVVRFTARVYSYYKRDRGDSLCRQISHTGYLDYTLGDICEVERLNIPRKQKQPRQPNLLEILMKNKSLGLGVFL